MPKTERPPDSKSANVPQDLRRRVNYYVKHLIQDHEGLFNAKQISVIIKTGAA